MLFGQNLFRILNINAKKVDHEVQIIFHYLQSVVMPIKARDPICRRTLQYASQFAGKGPFLSKIATSYEKWLLYDFSSQKLFHRNCSN